MPSIGLKGAGQWRLARQVDGTHKVHFEDVLFCFPFIISVFLFVRFDEDGSPKSLKAFLDSTGGGLTFSFRFLKMIKQEKI